VLELNKLTLWVTTDDDGAVTDFEFEWDRPEAKAKKKGVRLSYEVTELVRGAARSDAAAKRYLHYLRECVRMDLRVSPPGSGARKYVNIWHTDDRNYRAAVLTVGSGLLHLPYATEALDPKEWVTLYDEVLPVTNNGELTSGVKIYLHDDVRVERAIEMTQRVKGTRRPGPYSDSV
jgi:hypothetical protein